MNRMDSAVDAVLKNSNSWIEGGVFYPTAYIVLGLPNHSDALRLRKAFLKSGTSPNECILIAAFAMAEAAAKDLESEGAMASFGSTGHVREKQLQLAQEGCHFLMIKVSSEEDKDRVLEALAQVPVRYAVHYGRLVIEDLIAHIPSATADWESARRS